MDARELPPHPNLEQYKKLAKALVKIWKSDKAVTIRWEGVTAPITRERIWRRHPYLAKLSASEIESARFVLADAQFVIAREYGFESWPTFARHIEALTQETSPVSTFESAANTIISGDVGTLQSLLRESPQLIRERSTRVHRATLLHYVSANGVEDYRQKTPKNAVEVARVLLTAGSEVDALAETYGGGPAQTTLCLLVSSVHPEAAGIQADLVETLLDFGAAINGVEDDSLPLMTALAFGYLPAAETLVRRGARVNTLVAAAGLGLVELVRGFFHKDGSLKADVPRARDPWGGWIAEELQPERAFIWACMFGHADVAEFLLTQGVDPSAGASSGQSGFHLAAHFGHLNTVRMLIERKAPLEIENVYGGTILGQVLWSAVNEPQDDHVAIIKALLAAGANVDAVGGRDQVEGVLKRLGAQ